jgi:3-oxoacyl-[acyl-carrier-protein] synthase III
METSAGMAMRWTKVCVEAIGYELPSERVSTATLEASIEGMYRALHLDAGQVVALTGIRERRVWPPGTRMSDCGARAARTALDQAGLEGRDLGAVIYAGVCRDDLEPATACAIADAIGVRGDAMVFDVSNACLGVLNGMVEIANRIELGQMRAGIVVAAESSREIVEASIARMLGEPTMDRYRLGLATLTGGSGAVAVALTSAESSFSERRLVAGAALAAPEHHRICRWGPSRGLLGETANVMDTDASAVLEHGVALGRATWDRLLAATGWRAGDVDRVICHQVGAAHRDHVLAAIGLDAGRDYSTFETLGNIGTVSVPITAALAHEAGFLRRGDRVALLGIGSGLNCLMLGVQW